MIGFLPISYCNFTFQLSYIIFPWLAQFALWPSFQVWNSVCVCVFLNSIRHSYVDVCFTFRTATHSVHQFPGALVLCFFYDSLALQHWSVPRVSNLKSHPGLAQPIPSGCISDILTWVAVSVLCLFVLHLNARQDLLLVEPWSLAQYIHDEMLPEWAFQGSRSTALHRAYSGPAQSPLPPVHLISLWYPPFPSSAQHK